MEGTTEKRSDDRLERAELVRLCLLCSQAIRLERRVAPSCGEAELELASCGFHVFTRAAAS